MLEKIKNVRAFNKETAFFWGRLIEKAYDMYTNNRWNPNPPQPSDFPDGWNIIWNLNVEGVVEFIDETEFIGFIAQSTDKTKTGIIFRGTSSILDAKYDLEISKLPFTEIPNGGNTERGFTKLYRSLSAIHPVTGERKKLNELIPAQDSAAELTITGHSLGGALANLHGAVLAYHGYAPEVYTFAAPMTGDSVFASAYDTLVPNNFRIYNEPDAVPNLPGTLFGYMQVDGGIPIQSHNMPIRSSLLCYHELSTYLYTLGDTSVNLGSCALNAAGIHDNSEIANAVNPVKNAAETNQEHRLHTMHFDLRHAEAGEVLTLQVGSRQYPLHPQTKESLLQARRSPVLSAVSDEEITHYVNDVPFPKSHLMSYLVTSLAPDAPEEERKLLNFGIHFPTDHPATAEAASSDEHATAKLSAWEAVALKIIFTYPEIINLKPDIAGIIKGIIVASPYFQDVVNAIKSQGSGFAYLKYAVDHEGNPIRIKQARDTDNGPYTGEFRKFWAYSDLTKARLVEPMKAILKDIKDHPDLKGWNWRIQPGTVSAPANAGNVQLRNAGTITVAEAVKLKGEADELKLSVTEVGPQAGISFELKNDTTDNRVCTFELTNHFLRYVSVYVQFLNDKGELVNPDLNFLFSNEDGQLRSEIEHATTDGAAIQDATRKLFEQSGGITLSQAATIQKKDGDYEITDGETRYPLRFDAADGPVRVYLYDKWKYTEDGFLQELAGELVKVGLETDRTRFIGYLSSIPVIMAVPTGWIRQTFTVPIPKGAQQVRVLAGGGMGAFYFSHDRMLFHEQKETITSCYLGWLLTGVINFTVPTVLLGMGVGDDGLSERLMKKALDGREGILVPLLTMAGSVLYFADVIAIGGDSQTGRSIMSTLTDSLVGFVLGNKTVQMVLSGILVKDMAEEDLPLVGAVMEALNVLGAAAEIAETIVEELVAPIVIENVIAITFDSTVTMAHDPLDHGFPATARWYEVEFQFTDGTTRTSDLQPVNRDGIQTDPISYVVPNLPASGEFSVLVNFYADGNPSNPTTATAIRNNPVGTAKSGIYDATKEEAKAIRLVIKEMIPKLSEETTYSQMTKLQFDGKAHIWNAKAELPGATVADLDPAGQQQSLSRLVGISIDQLSGQIAYAWRSPLQHVPRFDSGETPEQGDAHNLYTFQSVSAALPAERLYAFTNAGFTDQVLVCMELLPPEEPNAEAIRKQYEQNPDASVPQWKQLGLARPPYHFFIQPDVKGENYYARSAELTGDPAVFNLNQTTSWGVFPTAVDSLAIHPKGYLAATYYNEAKQATKLYLLKLPDQAVPDDKAPKPKLASGYGTRTNLLKRPIAIGCTGKGAILVLDAGLGNVQAFDYFGNAVQDYFTLADGSKSERMPLVAQQERETFLDMAVEHLGFIYVLLYENDGSKPEDYRLDIYTPEGKLLTSKAYDKPVPAGKLTVDLFRNLYTLNFEKQNGPGGRLEPTVSELIPSISES
ncbi:MAG: lipase family protein [Bacillota bacterium]